MILEEAIKHAEEVAEGGAGKDCSGKCQMEHKQLAEWLKELRELKEFLDKGISIICMDIENSVSTEIIEIETFNGKSVKVGKWEEDGECRALKITIKDIMDIYKK